MTPIISQSISNAALLSEYLSLAELGGWQLDAGTSCMRLTARAAHILGFDAGAEEEVLVEREALCSRVDWGDRIEFRRCWEEALAGRPYETAYRVVLSSGETRWVYEVASMRALGKHQATAMVGVVQDVTRRKLKVLQQEGRDPLTGLPGRQFAMEHLHHMLHQARRRGSMLAVLFLDLDRFKQVNDLLGHAAGDIVLREVARRMKANLREGDIVVRQGGDEFLIVLPDINHESDGGVVALKLVETLSAPYAIDGVDVQIGASVGIAIFPHDGFSADELVKQADVAMYKSKLTGRNTLSFFDPGMAVAARERSELEADLRSALANGEFVLHYQPVCFAANRQVHSVEALIRWDHPQRGLLEPKFFLEHAEKTGFIRELGRWVVKEVCWQLARWSRTNLRVSLNVSAAQIPAGLSVAWLRSSLEESGIDPSRLILEITETMPLLDSLEVRQWFMAVRELGVRVALDDFGVGHSSFAYLQCLRPHHLKIDKSFIQGMMRDPEQKAVVKAMVALGQTMGLMVTAEGVEDKQTLQAVTDIGCELAQGFHLARPLPAPELLAHLDDVFAPVPVCGTDALSRVHGLARRVL